MIVCTKMNGNGNDFIVIDNMALAFSADELSQLAPLICRRGRSVGADGILSAEPSECADFKMRLFNSDGSEGEMCGNGARCIARYAYEKGIVGLPSMRFETLSGCVRASVEGRAAELELAPVSLDGVKTADASVEGYDFTYTYITVGVPHAVVFEKRCGINFEEYATLGRAIRNRLDLFPHGANVNFAVAAKDGLDVITYERGVENMTLSCGTGSTASAIAWALRGCGGTEIRVTNPGGVNVVKLVFSEDRQTVYPRLEGSVFMTAEMTVFPDALL